MNRKKRYFDDIWNFNFEDMIHSFEEEIASLMQASPSEYHKDGPISFGYSMRIGPDTAYRPEVRQWGNLNDYRRKQGLPEVQFPLKAFSKPLLQATSTSEENFVDFIDEDKHLKIIAEVPGFTKENLTIDINEEGSEIILSGKSESKELNQKIILPSKIEVNSIKSSINNGVLEIRGKKIKNSSKKFRVKID
ncbi:MAG: Hsp20/alpha crystallin family protein [Promethearchaeota archaeon]